MKIIIQCAGGKHQGAGSFLFNGMPVKFVAKPGDAPPDDKYAYAHPDDISDDGRISWREKLLDYNERHREENREENREDNPYCILPAYQLYKNAVYKALVNEFGADNVFILSAGWGLIPADFLTPIYDITFSPQSSVASFKKRNKKDKYRDFNMLPDDGQDIIFFGGKNYQPMLYRLTEGRKGRKIIVYRSKNPPNAPDGFELKLYETTTKTNWHYGCAQAFIKRKFLA